MVKGDGGVVVTAEIYIELLKRLANNMAIRFHCPFFLVGSFVDRGLDAMDVDIIMVASPDRIKRLFRSPYWNERWFRFYKKQKEYFEHHIDLDIDFKVQTPMTFNMHTGVRLKLDDIIPYEPRIEDTYVESPGSEPSSSGSEQTGD